MDAEERRPKKRALLQVKGTSGFLTKNFFGLSLLPIMLEIAEIDEMHANRLNRRNDLNRLPIMNVKRSSKRFVPLHDDIEGPFQGCDIEVPFEGDRRSQVVDRTARLKLVKKPQSLLGKGKRDRPTV